MCIRDRDMQTGEVSSTGLPTSNVLYYDLSDDAWLCVRPRIARRQIHDGEHDKQHAQQCRDDQKQPFYDVLKHSHSPLNFPAVFFPKAADGSHCGGMEDVAYATCRRRRIPQAGFFFSMKALSSGCADCVLARKDAQTFDNRAEMSCLLYTSRCV